MSLTNYALAWMDSPCWARSLSTTRAACELRGQGLGLVPFEQAPLDVQVWRTRLSEGLKFRSGLEGGNDPPAAVLPVTDNGPLG